LDVPNKLNISSISNHIYNNCLYLFRCDLNRCNWNDKYKSMFPRLIVCYEYHKLCYDRRSSSRNTTEYNYRSQYKYIMKAQRWLLQSAISNKQPIARITNPAYLYYVRKYSNCLYKFKIISQEQYKSYVLICKKCRPIFVCWDSNDCGIFWIHIRERD